jgi:gliding motility-associated-like protein
LCSYAKIELKPNGVFPQYLWSTAAISPSITVQQGGLYWLQVTDKYNCTGRDSLLLTSKQCLTGFFVPNAFTPHKDGRNDIFKPIILGNIVQFEFTIYNRWGQRVFQSANWQLGWDGTVAGKQQSNDTFVWTCRYQFDNGPVTFEKGTVTLVR